MKLCTKYGMTVVPFGGGTSLEGQTLSPYKKGVSIDFKNMREVLELNEKVRSCTVQGTDPKDLVRVHRCTDCVNETFYPIASILRLDVSNLLTAEVAVLAVFAMCDGIAIHVYITLLALTHKHSHTLLHPGSGC